MLKVTSGLGSLVLSKIVREGMEGLIMVIIHGNNYLSNIDTWHTRMMGVLYIDCVFRFHHYDCLVMPVFSIAANFPWEKVALLVEYEPLGSELWGLEGGRLPANLRLRHWVALRTMRDVSVAALAQSGGADAQELVTGSCAFNIF